MGSIYQDTDQTTESLTLSVSYHFNFQTYNLTVSIQLSMHPSVLSAKMPNMIFLYEVWAVNNWTQYNLIICIVHLQTINFTDVMTKHYTIHLSIHPSTHPSSHPPMPSVHPSTHPSIYSLRSIHPHTYQPIHPSIRSSNGDYRPLCIYV